MLGISIATMPGCDCPQALNVMLAKPNEVEVWHAGHVTQQGAQVQLQHGPAPWLAYTDKWGSTVEAPALQEWFAKAENPVSRSWLAQAGYYLYRIQ